MSSHLVIPKSQWKDLWHTYNGIFPGKAQFTEKDYPTLDGKVVIVTGASTGVGFEVAKSLAGSTNAKIYIFARNKEKTEAAIKRLELEVAQEYNKPKSDVHFIQIDLSDLTTIKPAAEEFLSKEKRIDIIIHNAGVMTPPLGSETKQGYELQLGTNNIAPHLLQRFLDPLLIETSKTNKPGESRIVWVASTASFHAPEGGIHYADYNFKETKASPMNIYGQSKATNVLQSRYWSKAHPEAANVISCSLCPGFLRTELQRHLQGIEAFVINLLLHPARNGAYTELFAALSPEVKTGDYIESFGKVSIARDDFNDAAAKKAWEFLDEKIKPYL
ncbi:short-chain alcohol dehydrogenase [Scheffersomyces coipomensis]|uniref:short-chain alcohol dehydrogenase n=1 Tax=Scheffersomyces coipomensis TaxID=1788519 RepID=UPI00315CEA43